MKLLWMVPLVGCMIALFVAGPRHRVGIFGIDRDPVVFRNPPKEGPKDKQQGGWFLVSWKDQTLTLHHRGYMYRARCEKTVYGRSPYDDDTFSNCNEEIISFIGSTLPDAPRFDLRELTQSHVPTEQYVTDVSIVGGDLTIHRYKDGKFDSVWQEWTQSYSIDEVSPLPPGAGLDSRK